MRRRLGSLAALAGLALSGCSTNFNLASQNEDFAVVSTTHEVETGARIGYGGMHVAERPMRLAILAAGYADGIPHRLGNRGEVIVSPGVMAPIVGAVSMDLTTIDATDCPSLKVGDAVTLLGEQGSVSINAQQMARTAGTISYSVLCGINPRVKRVYVD